MKGKAVKTGNPVKAGKVVWKGSPGRQAAKDAIGEEDIRVAAYYIWLERDCGHGRHEEDWLLAERKLQKGNANRKG